VEGFIGDDPNDPAKFFNPSDVDFYHFHIAAGTYAFAAEVFGGRIGSPLDPALSLFRQTDSGLEFVAGNTTTGNTTLPTEGGPPLLSDAALFVPLTRGDYYLAVSSGFNYADPEGGLIPGQDGVFDPEIPYKGENGNSIGRYVLNLKVQQATTPPRVIGMTLVDGEAFAGPPTTFRVDFSGPVNVQELAFFAYVRTSESRVSPVFIRDAGGHLYFPRLQSYDPTTYRATFLMVDALPRGSYELHLSGPLGLTDLAGNALVGNDPSGDHVTRFSVGGPARGTPGNPSAWQSREPNDSLDSPQVLGPLFPAELDSTHTVTITVPAPPKGAGGGDTGDFFQFDLLQEQDYVFALSDATALDAETVPVIWGKGILQATLPQGPGAVFAHLTPGTYIVGVSFPSGGADVSYTLTLFMLGSPEPATPLTAGPAPALRVRLVGEEATSPGGPAQPPGFPSLLSLSGTEAGPPTVTNLGLPGIFLALADAPLGGMGGSDPATQGGTQVVRLDLSSPEQQAVNPLLTVLVAQSVLPGGVDGTIEPSPEGGAGKESDTFGEFQEFLRQRLPVGALLGEVSRTTSCLTEGGQRLTRMLDGLFETVGQWASSRDLLVPERPQGDRTSYVETHGSRERVVARQVVETEDSCAEGAACEVRSPTGGLWWVSASLGLFLGALRGWRWWGNRAGRRPALRRGEGVIPPKTDTEDWAG